MRDVVLATLFVAVLTVGITIGTVLLTLHSMEYTTSTRGRNPDGTINWVIHLYIGPFCHTIKVDDYTEQYKKLPQKEELD